MPVKRHHVLEANRQNFAGRDWSISPVRIYTGIFETSLNGPGFSVTLGNLTGIATTMEIPVDEIIAMLDAPTTAPAWPKNAYFDADESNEAAESRYTSNAQMQDSAMQDMGPKGMFPLCGPPGP